MFTIGYTLNCSYGGLGEEVNDLHSLRAIEDKAYGCFTRFPVSGHRLGLLYITVSIPIRGGQISNKLRLQSLNPTQHWSCWRPWGHPTQVQGSQKVDLPLPAQGSGPWKDVTPQLA